VQFINHPKVQRASLEQRRAFLRNKGVTDAEIDEAIRIAKPDLSQIGAVQVPRSTPTVGLQPLPLGICVP